MLICDRCNREFKRKENLSRHIDNKVCHNKKFGCKYCECKFTSKVSMYRHIRENCKKKDEINSEDNDNRQEIYEKLLESQMTMHCRIENLEKENEELKKKIKKKLSKTINNINNGTINNINNINILVGYGNEDLSKIGKSHLLKSFKTGFNSTYNLINMIHFNPEHPEFHNIYISSMKNNYAMLYDGDDWTLVTKDDLIDKLYDDKRNYIEDNLDDFLESLTESQKRALNRWMNVEDDHPYIRKIKNDIKLLLYNKRKMPINNKIKYDRSLEDDIISISNDISEIREDNTNLRENKSRSKKLFKIKPAERLGTKRKVVNAKK